MDLCEYFLTTAFDVSFWWSHCHSICLGCTYLSNFLTGRLRFRVQDTYFGHLLALRNASDGYFGIQIPGLVSESSLDLWIQGACESLPAHHQISSESPDMSMEKLHPGGICQFVHCYWSWSNVPQRVSSSKNQYLGISVTWKVLKPMKLMRKNSSQQIRTHWNMQGILSLS